MLSVRHALLFPAALGAGLLAFAFEPPTAEACGGFFCSATPVDQSGEAILYAKEPDGTLVMSVRIQYEGEDDAFAWILPVPVVPELSAGTEAVFDALGRSSEPSFFIDDWRTTGTCRAEPECYDDVTGDRCDFGGRDDDSPTFRGGASDAAVAPSGAQAGDR